jgi:hypothetical protein
MLPTRVRHTRREELSGRELLGQAGVHDDAYFSGTAIVHEGWRRQREQFHCAATAGDAVLPRFSSPSRDACLLHTIQSLLLSEDQLSEFESAQCCLQFPICSSLYRVCL